MLELTIPAMSCGHCVAAITDAVRSADPAARVDADLPSHTVRIDTTADRATVAAALSEAGYAPDGAAQRPGGASR